MKVNIWFQNIHDTPVAGFTHEHRSAMYQSTLPFGLWLVVVLVLKLVWVKRPMGPFGLVEMFH